jgi:hypothetical protein
LAQGTIIIENGPTGRVKTWASPVDTTLIDVPVGGGFVEVLAAPAGTALPNPNLTGFSSLAPFLAANPGWAVAASSSGSAVVPISGLAGCFAGPTVTINNIAAGGYAEYFVIAWTGSSVTWDQAFASGALVGESAIFITATGNPLADPPELPVSLATTFTGMTLGGCLGYFKGFAAQPTNQTVLVGATATFCVAAISCPAPYYQWYFN